MNLKGELHNLKKGADTVNLYLPKIKVVRDKLPSVGVIIDDEKLLHITIKGLPKEYNALWSGIRTKSTQLSFDELLTMLNVEDESLNEGLDVKDPIFAMAAATTSKLSGNSYNQYNKGMGKGNYNNRGGRRGRGPSNQLPQYNQFTYFQQNQSNSTVAGPRSERPTCQICGKLGHLAIDCYYRMDYAYQGKHQPTKLAIMTIASNAYLAQEQPWFADNAATDHVTSSPN